MQANDTIKRLIMLVTGNRENFSAKDSLRPPSFLFCESNEGLGKSPREIGPRRIAACHHPRQPTSFSIWRTTNSDIQLSIPITERRRMAYHAPFAATRWWVSSALSFSLLRANEISHPYRRTLSTHSFPKMAFGHIW
jgi:hypothetical protein